MGSMQHYSVQRKIGTGSYGNAYLVTRNENKGRNDTKLVLKRINIKDASKEEKQAAHFEAKILKEFTHPFVLSCKDSFQHGPYMCIITDYCAAGDLYERLKKQSQKGQYLDEKHILRWLVQISSALQYVHEKNLLHRDLKTQNIFLTAKGDIMLGDFGIARVLKSKKDMARTVIGTPYYMSPEIMESKPYSYKSDLWSLGCILFEMMSLKHAFDANDMNGLIMKIIRGKIPPLPNKYSPELKQLTTALLSKIPSRRPSLESILKMKFLQSTVKGVQAAIVNYNQEQFSAPMNGLGNGNLRNGHQVRLDKSIPDMRKQLQIQMRKQNVDQRPKSREKQVLIDPRQVRAKPQAANEQRKNVQPKQIRHQAPSLDVAVDIAEQRLKNIHKEFRAVRVQAKKLEEAVNLSEDNDRARAQRLRQKDVNKNHQYAKPPHQAKQQHRAPEPRRRSAGSELNRHQEENRRRSAGSELNRHQEENRRRSAGSELNRHQEENRRRSAGPELSRRDESRTPEAPSFSGNAKDRAKDARMQRKIEANRKYEEQLEQARKSYYEEKKAAMQKKQDLYKESSPPARSRDSSQYDSDVNDVRNLVDYDYGEEEVQQPIPEERMGAAEAKRRYEEELEEARRCYYEEKRAALEKKHDLYKESSPPAAEPPHHGMRGGHAGYSEDNSEFIVQEKMVYSDGKDSNKIVNYDDEENFEFQVEESFVYDAIPEEKEAVNIDTGVFAQGGVVDKVNAIRDYCLEKLGSVLFHELCGLIKLHNSRALTSASDVEYAGEILERLGEPRIHFAGLIDHLLYLEEQLY